MEGKPFKKFLHLEDVHTTSPLVGLKDSSGNLVKDTEGILNILCKFYWDLYSEVELSPSKSQI